MSSLALFKLIMRGEDPKIQIPLKVGHHRSAIWRFADGLVAFRFSGDPDQPIALRFFMGGGGVQTPAPSGSALSLAENNRIGFKPYFYELLAVISWLE